LPKGEFKVQIPPRCYTCGKLIGHLYEEFITRTETKGEDPEKVLDELGIRRFCCRRIMISNREIVDELIKFA